ncbi:MAG: hypothetical protein V3575_01755 [Candidatus Absconditabacteria bacterium]
MEFYSKIYRRLLKKNNSIEDVLGEKKLNRIGKDLKYLDNNGYNYGIKKLNIDDLKCFYEHIYKPEIEKKANSKTTDLVSKYSPRLDSEQIFFAHISQGEKIIGGEIIILKDNKLMLSFKSNIDHFKNELKSGIGLLLDYLFLYYGFNNLEFDFFSYGKDRNCYGELGAGIGLALYKLRLNFTPFISETDGKTNIDNNSLSNPTLVFFPTGDNGECKKIGIKNIEKQTDLEFLKEKGFELLNL